MSQCLYVYRQDAKYLNAIYKGHKFIDESIKFLNSFKQLHVDHLQPYYSNINWSKTSYIKINHKTENIQNDIMKLHSIMTQDQTDWYNTVFMIYVNVCTRIIHDLTGNSSTGSQKNYSALHIKKDLLWDKMLFLILSYSIRYLKSSLLWCPH